MTTTTKRSQIAAADLQRITVELDVARDDLALLERLKSAQDRANRLSTDHAKVTKELDRAIAAEAKADKAARFAGISNLSVTESPETLRENVLRSSWTIHWTKPTWDGRSNLPTRHSRNGFGICPPEVLDYLIERCPERIPAKIMALAPDNPPEAFGRYFRGLKRGCFIG